MQDREVYMRFNLVPIDAMFVQSTGPKLGQYLLKSSNYDVPYPPNAEVIDWRTRGAAAECMRKKEYTRTCRVRVYIGWRKSGAAMNPALLEKCVYMVMQTLADVLRNNVIYLEMDIGYKDCSRIPYFVNSINRFVKIFKVTVDSLTGFEQLKNLKMAPEVERLAISVRDGARSPMLYVPRDTDKYPY